MRRVLSLCLLAAAMVGLPAEAADAASGVADLRFVNSGTDICIQSGPTRFACSFAGVEPPSGVTVKALMPGVDQACGIQLDDSVVCWDSGRPTVEWFTGPVQPALDPPADLGKVQMLSGGWRHMCALTLAGAVRCWGKNDYTDIDWGYQFGQTEVPDLAKSQVVAISGSGVHTCAIRADGRLICWGSDWYGQSSVPADLEAVSSVSASEGTCVVTVSGKAHCWGGGPPVGEVPDLAEPQEDARFGYLQQCALSVAGVVRCWGDDTWWDRGSYSVPDDVRTSRASGIAAIGGLSCAYIPENHFGLRVRCWGSSPADGQIVQDRLNRADAWPGFLTPPRDVSVQTSDSSATVTWSPPQSDGGISVTSFTAKASPSGRACTTSTNSCTITGLTNRQAYTFTVTATNLAGTSAPSAPSAVVMPLASGFAAWPTELVLAAGLSTKINLVQAAPGVAIAVTGATKVTVTSDSAGSATASFTAMKGGIPKFTAKYSVKLGKRTTTYITSTQLYVPSVTGPGKVRTGKTGKFSMQFMPPGAAISIALSDGRTVTGTADLLGKASFTPTFSTLGAVTYTANVAGVQIGTGGLTVAK